MTKADAPVYRLSDIEVEEVSIVDRAANQRKFLIAKNQPAEVEADKATGTQAPAPAPAPTPPPAPAPPPEPEPDPGPKTEPTMRLSPEMKAELAKRVAAATERLKAIATLVTGAEEVAGLLEIPAELVTKVAELVSGLSDGDVAKGELVIKGLPQFSSTRLSQLQAAHAALGAIIEQVSPAPTPAPSAAADPAADPSTAEGDGLSKKLDQLEDAVAKGIAKVAALIGKQGAEIARASDAIAKQAARIDKVEAIDRQRPTTNAEPENGDPVIKSAGDDGDADGGVWPADMASETASKRVRSSFAA